MRIHLVVSAVTVSCLIASVVVHSSVPTTMNAQGRLTDAAGTPLPPGFKQFTFSIHSTPSGGSPIWSEASQFISSNSNGLWNATLGEDTPLTSSVFADTSRWLEITVDDGINPAVTLPRVKLITTPYAFQADQTMHSMSADSAGHADHATYADTAAFSTQSAADDDWTVTDTILYTADLLGIVRGGADNSYSGDSGHTTINLGIACTTGSYYSTVGGGKANRATGISSMVAGGVQNRSTGLWATSGGVIQNAAEGIASFVGGGSNNRSSAIGATVGGGTLNHASGDWSVVAGGGGQVPGDGNSASGDYSSVTGGSDIHATGEYASIAGGHNNFASGEYSMAAGRGARALHHGSIVLSAPVDLGSVDIDTVWSGGEGQIILRAGRGIFLTRFGQHPGFPRRARSYRISEGLQRRLSLLGRGPGECV